GGGEGRGTYVCAGSSPGNVTVNEFAPVGPDLSVDTLDFSSYTGGALNLDLAMTTQQAAAPGLMLTLADAAGIENVVGTAFADTIRGNNRDNQLLGADLMPTFGAGAPPWNGRTQVVFLDFDSQTDPGEHLYSQAERDAIQARLVAAYVGPDPSHPWFHFQFTQSPPAGDHATIFFNQPPLQGEQETGGFSSELDFRNLNLGTTANPSSASVQVNG